MKAVTGTPSAERIAELMRERFAIVPYDAQWPLRYAEEEHALRALLPPGLAVRIDHIGSTAIPGLSAKPIIDVQVEVTDLERVRQEVAPMLMARGYEYIWRPTIGERAPFYAWFIKRDANGERTHHIHMVEPDQASEDRIVFRDHLLGNHAARQAYAALKKDLALRYPADRAAYTQAKTRFIAEALAEARLKAK
jgi:GrpB-like predicted nucleotidyltransferase (UPF0157 family)